jgi:hypothetical protein
MRPRGRPFVKGQSGNPSGTAKGGRGLAAHIQSKTRQGRALVEKMLAIAEKNDDPFSQIAAIKWLADRGFGKAQEASATAQSLVNIERGIFVQGGGASALSPSDIETLRQLAMKAKNEAAIPLDKTEAG